MSLTPITRMTTSISNKARKHKSKMKRQAREMGYYFIDGRPQGVDYPTPLF